MEMPLEEVGDYAIDPRTVLDLSARMDRDGKLHWDVPAGAWTVIRIGQTARDRETCRRRRRAAGWRATS